MLSSELAAALAKAVKADAVRTQAVIHDPLARVCAKEPLTEVARGRAMRAHLFFTTRAAVERNRAALLLQLGDLGSELLQFGALHHDERLHYLLFPDKHGHT